MSTRDECSPTLAVMLVERRSYVRISCIFADWVWLWMIRFGRVVWFSCDAFRAGRTLRTEDPRCILGQAVTVDG